MTNFQYPKATQNELVVQALATASEVKLHPCNENVKGVIYIFIQVYSKHVYVVPWLGIPAIFSESDQ